MDRDRDIGKSIASLKSQLDELEAQYQQTSQQPKGNIDEFHKLLEGHIDHLILLLQQETVTDPGSLKIEKLKRNDAGLLEGPYEYAVNKVLKIVNPKISGINSTIHELRKDIQEKVKSAEANASDALNTAKNLESNLEDKFRTAIMGLLGSIAKEKEKVNVLVDNAVRQTLNIAGKVSGSIDNLDNEFQQAEDAIRKKIQEEFEDPDSPLHSLLDLLQLARIFIELGHDLEERIEIVIHSAKDLLEDTQSPVIELLEAVQKLITAVKAEDKQEIKEELVNLLVTLMVTINPIAAALEALFVGKKRSLRQLLTPGIPQTGTLYKWMRDVSGDYASQRIERERAFRRMVVGAIDSYIRTGHTGKKVGNITNGTYEPGGTLRPVDLRPLVASGVELASVLCGALLSYLFIPSGVPNPAVPKLPHVSPSKPHPFDFRADMAASVARTATQPVMSIAAIVLNGFWEVSPNNRALVNAISGYLGIVVRSLFEHLLSGILHLFEVHEVYPNDRESRDGYLELYDWDSWNTISNDNALKFRVYLDLHVVYNLIPEDVDKNDKQAVQKALNETKNNLQKLINGIQKEKDKNKEDSVLLGLLKDYVAYREAVMDYHPQRPDGQGIEIKDFTVEPGGEEHSVHLIVKVDDKNRTGPSVPVVRVFGGNGAPVVLVPNSNNRYTGKMNVPPLSRLTKQLTLYARSNYGGMKSAEVF
ncbi:hypothetical protein [Aliifodinibius sp. S!AR15-10]|uniref:hypothetical protein n=1 Tax=Aliifodinibius sp. S!AR15-10 TaxID=2950437 RepID=UPI00286FEFDD|nr:hypothetical protein [Aliifodinibius sp. S!AR15-10]